MILILILVLMLIMMMMMYAAAAVWGSRYTTIYSFDDDNVVVCTKDERNAWTRPFHTRAGFTPVYPFQVSTMSLLAPGSRTDLRASYSTIERKGSILVVDRG
jgi:hypothetical protein